jgi:nicotinamidase-related amidase
VSTRRLADLARVIRSKNAGPFELTLDVIFPDRETYGAVKHSGYFTRERVAALYHVPVRDVYEVVCFDPANAIKITLARQRPQGSVGESDTYGAQQHAPLLDVELPWPGGPAEAATDYAHQFNPAFRLEPRSVALVVVDMQYASGSREHGLGRALEARGQEALGAWRFDRIERSVVPAIQRLLAFFRDRGLRVVFLTVGSELPDYSDLLPHMRAFAEGANNTRGNKEHEILDAVAPRPDEAVLNKTTMSAFHSSGFERLLRAWGVEQLLFTGISTNSCVEGTARDAADRGFRCLLVEDACGAASQALHDAACTNFARLLGRVAPVATVLAELEEALRLTRNMGGSGRPPIPP